MESILGYNVVLKVNDKLLVGVTQDDLSITATTKESITKDNKGDKESVVTGHSVAFTVAGIMKKKGDETTYLDSDDIIDMALLKGDEAKIPFVYTRGALTAYSGNAIITSYGESTGAEEEGTYSLNLTVSGSLTKVTQ